MSGKTAESKQVENFELMIASYATINKEGYCHRSKNDRPVDRTVAKIMAEYWFAGLVRYVRTHQYVSLTV